MTLDDQTPEGWRDLPEKGTGLLLIDDVKVYAPEVTYAQALEGARAKKAEAIKWVPHSAASLAELQSSCAVPEPSRYLTAIDLLDGACRYTYRANGHILALDRPECLMCGDLDIEASMGGPLICAWCDMGKNRDGSRWTIQQATERQARMDRRVRETSLGKIP